MLYDFDPRGWEGVYPLTLSDHLEIPNWEFRKSIIETPLGPLEVSSERAHCVLPNNLSSTFLGASEIPLGTHQVTHFGFVT